MGSERVGCYWATELNWSIGWIQGQAQSVQFSHSVLSNSLQPHRLQHTRLPVHHQLPKLAQNHVHWVSDAIQPSHPLLFPSLLPSIFPRKRVFSMNQLFESVGQSTGVSASTSVVPRNIQDWFPLGWTGWISWQLKRLSPQYKNIHSSALRSLYI